MKSVNTKGLMLGMLAIGGLTAGGAMFNAGQQAYATLIGGGDGGIIIIITIFVITLAD
jgi:hypothetical protein